MEPNTLPQLLRQADREAGGPRPIAGDLPGRVRQLARRRRRILVRNGALAVGLVVTLGVLLGPQLRRQQESVSIPIANSSAPSLDNELLALKAEAESLRAEILAAQPAPARAIPRPVMVTRSVDDELERAAYLIVYQADRYHHELDMPESAIASYRQTIDLFPRTRAAQTARDRLSQLENTKGHQS